MIKAIVAMNHQYIIGFQNQLPWNIPEDLQHFRKTTLHQAVVMGRKTFESIQKPLPNRINYVLTRQTNFPLFPGLIIINNLTELIEKYQTSNEVLYVIGGAEVYKQFLPYCDELIISMIPGDFRGDAFFPQYLEQFQLVHIDARDSFSIHYYKRRHSV